MNIVRWRLVALLVLVVTAIWPLLLGLAVAGGRGVAYAALLYVVCAVMLGLVLLVGAARGVLR